VLAFQPVGSVLNHIVQVFGGAGEEAGGITHLAGSRCFS
jgi:hypothetical protein